MKWTAMKKNLKRSFISKVGKTLKKMKTVLSEKNVILEPWFNVANRSASNSIKTIQYRYINIRSPKFLSRFFSVILLGGYIPVPIFFIHIDVFQWAIYRLLQYLGNKCRNRIVIYPAYNSNPRLNSFSKYYPRTGANWLCLIRSHLSPGCSLWMRYITSTEDYAFQHRDQFELGAQFERSSLFGSFRALCLTSLAIY